MTTAKPKPVPYLVTLHNGTQLSTEDKAQGFHAGLLKDGFFHEGAWYPPTAILRVERRDTQ